MDGILLIDKPKGISSFGVVSKVRGVWRAKLRENGESPKKAKVGHTGTLDPLATGLMILVLGSYTKCASEFSKLSKSYKVSFALGSNSTTGDEEGDKSTISDKVPSRDQLIKVLSTFTGTIKQTPPSYSAIKVGGQRAYKLARQGKTVVIEPRSVIIYSLELSDYTYPIVSCTVKVSSGTYIRSLVSDIGEKLGTGAYITELRRTEVGDFIIKDSLTIKGLSYDMISSKLLTP